MNEIIFTLKDVLYIGLIVSSVLSAYFVLKNKVDRIDKELIETKDHRKSTEAKIDAQTESINQLLVIVKEHRAYHQGREDQKKEQHGE